MIHPRKPVWTEGLFMTPQHLQQGRPVHEALVQARTTPCSYDWGVVGVQFDERSLTAGQLKRVKCHGFFPDGTPFFVGDRGRRRRRGEAPRRGVPCRARGARRFFRDAASCDAAANIALDPAKAGPAIRFVAATPTVSDINTGSQRDGGRLGSRAPCAFSSAPRRATRIETVRIAQLVRDRTGAIVLKKTFIPPSCTSACQST
jgi:type VI secretion system protein ImpJ